VKCGGEEIGGLRRRKSENRLLRHRRFDRKENYGNSTNSAANYGVTENGDYLFDRAMIYLNQKTKKSSMTDQERRVSFHVWENPRRRRQIDENEENVYHEDWKEKDYF
jgi:hypothetical protein